MSFLLDTNVVSEWIRPRPDPGVMAWCASVDEDRTFISVATIAELRYGIERLAAGRRRARLEDWIENALLNRFEGRILSIDVAIGDAWGRIVALADQEGRPANTIDAFLASTAELHHLTVVTRNIADFRKLTKSVFNPWNEL
ncbi:MAG: type II toxin-antitoxin system VapC family toxin [Candidatus Angelobacter sp.]